MRLSLRTSLALRALMACAIHPQGYLRSRDLARRLGASGNHLGQVVFDLGRTGYLRTQRGRAGGFALARAASTISVGEIFVAMERDAPLSGCLDGGQGCARHDECRLHAAYSAAYHAFVTVLDGVSIHDLVAGNDGLLQCLGFAPEPAMSPAECAAPPSRDGCPGRQDAPVAQPEPALSN